MSYSRAEMTYASALNRNELFASISLRDEGAKVLDPDEEVLLVLPGVAGDYPNVLIVTSTRIVLAKLGGVMRRAVIKREAPAQAITGASFGGGPFSVMKVHVSGGRDLRMMPHRKQDAARFAGELEHLIRTGRTP